LVRRVKSYLDGYTSLRPFDFMVANETIDAGMRNPLRGRTAEAKSS
jgi:hypothetical protein